ncbi:MAG: DCC1-like thiol-disulfide oxidoreductase family protein [Nostoc sp. ChiQUE02]|uniref:DCC1-like thiol-disulfide oxidoreductase family protein n=1 Tax=Nostoc sp. ChiQUE02 TaxID=3075377 RepID=UPI002AD59C68|nr:DCC1-like thiol-disulfide oxidoreductase family protein [Nostoc sp. ChiQUE02]MDZ8233438.1 DCC1-like thiol-disulfide oxidoreductase family protein [Nostoc sp. ChiQUE02]
MISNVSLKAKVERFYKHNKTLVLIHSLVALLWPIAVWLMYLLFPDQLKTRILLSRVIFIAICLQLLVLGVQKRHFVVKKIREFFTGTTYPINLAIFRILLFESIFSLDLSQIVWFSELPKELLFPPIGSGWLINIIPINATIAQIGTLLLKIFSFTAMIGLFTRTSAWLTVILSFYVLGIPQFYGKVDHYHHLLWFAAILAASPCADVLSLDAIFKSWKRADRGQLESPGLSRAYALPLRFIWLLLSIIYLFPGLYKLLNSGFDWAFSENLKYRLYSIWLDRDGWIPAFRLDQYPVLYQLSALGSIFFELSFIFLIFFSRTRTVLPFAGFSFHFMIYQLMKIDFTSLLKAYVTFFDFNAIFHGIGHRLFPKDMYVVYDGNCKLCRRTIATLRVFDILGRLTFVNALDNQALTNHNLLWLDSQALMADMHTVFETKSWKGFLAYRVLLRRMPILWPILPLLYVWPIPVIAKRIYRRVADSRTCSLPQAEIPKISKPNYQPRTYSQVVMVVGTTLCIANLIAGLTVVYTGWPFSAYPPFASLSGPQTVILELVPISSTGTPIPSAPKDLKKEFAAHRFTGLTKSILKETDDPIKKQQQLNALWQVYSRSYPEFQQAKSVKFYETTIWNAPERRLEKPIQQSLIFELNLKPKS